MNIKYSYSYLENKKYKSEDLITKKHKIMIV